MRGSSGRLAIAAAVVLGVGVLAVVGRLLPATSSVRSSATGPRPAPAIRTAPGNTRGYGVPNVLGRTLAQAEGVLDTGGLRGAAIEGDPQGSSTVVVAQEPPAGATVPQEAWSAFEPGPTSGPTASPTRCASGLARPRRATGSLPPIQRRKRSRWSSPCRLRWTCGSGCTLDRPAGSWWTSPLGWRAADPSTDRSGVGSRSVPWAARSLGCGPSASPSARLGRQRSRSRSPSPGRNPARSSARSALGPCHNGRAWAWAVTTGLRLRQQE